MKPANREVVTLAGVDLAWIGRSNPSAVGIGELHGKILTVTACHPAVYGAEAVTQLLRESQARGVAIDAPLIIKNVTGAREGERALSRAYGSRKAGCYPSNLTRFPEADSVKLARQLEHIGYTHLGTPDKRWQIECYPHPAIIEIFGLSERLAYKKGDLQSRRQGQAQLASFIGGLASAEPVRLILPEPLQSIVNPARIHQLGGQALKSNEDALDGLICLYIAALYQVAMKGQTFGSSEAGYIWVPMPMSPIFQGSVDIAPASPVTAKRETKPRPEYSVGQVFQSGNGASTHIGFVNRNHQKVHGHRGRDGTDHGQKVYKLECLNPECRLNYGVNGSGIYQSKCRQCQGGKLNLKY